MTYKGIIDTSRIATLYIREGEEALRKLTLALQNFAATVSVDEPATICLEGYCLDNEQLKIVDDTTEKDWEEMILNGKTEHKNN